MSAAPASGSFGRHVARFDASIEMAHRLIKRNGMVCDWETVASTLIDATKPWLGSTEVVTVRKPYICFVPASGGNYNFIKALGGATDNPMVTTYGLMAPQSFSPVKTNLVKRSGEPLKIEYINTLQPNEQVVLHILGLVG